MSKTTNTNQVILFRLVSYLEGISYLILLFIGVPMKYMANDPTIVKSIGMPHGILFIIYIFLAIVIRQKLQWNTTTFISVLIASVIPFGTFYVDKKYL